MNNKLFVGNISWDSTEESLKEFFSQVGEVVEVKIIYDRNTGRSKGFGFVTMGSPEEAQKAITELNGKDCDGRELRIDEARPQKEDAGPAM
jgi:RNA recognition motif-containing protein